ncbi:DedA family inner membrane protein YqjA [Klebsiella pneumoniae]|uniref:DedA family inner membrane protein YqjA n=1 Tax=Klebsiella pneumoniae TaxID=573 RepID=A0A378BN45_KLEPN|nr:DedA family inner membrane protein YqjA [Klebsiella pneumoniae]
MELFTQLLNALWAQDYETLANPSMIGMLYFVLFMILFLENGLLPAAFLPGDSLLVLVGVLIAKGAMGFSGNLAAAHRRRQPRLLAKLYSGALAG